MSNYMHYQEKIDQLYNGFSSHRTLRTLFDCFASEWDKTSFQKKENMLLAMQNADKPIDFFVKGYIHFYTTELYNKAYVVNALPASIGLLCQNIKDEALKEELLKIKANFVENHMDDE